MLRKRIIAVLLVRYGRVVQSIGFNRYLPVGKPKIALEFLNQWGVDEIVIMTLKPPQMGPDRLQPFMQ